MAADPNVHDTGYEATPAGWPEHHRPHEAQQLKAIERSVPAVLSNDAEVPSSEDGSGC